MTFYLFYHQYDILCRLATCVLGYLYMWVCWITKIIGTALPSICSFYSNVFSFAIGIDGEAGYKQALKTINGELRNVGQELRAVTKEFVGNANSIDALTAKNRVLEKEVELHRVKVELLSKEYKNQTDELKKLEQKLEETKKAHSEDSEEVKKAQKEYDTQASKVRKLDSDIGTATATLNRYTKEMDVNTASIKDQSSETGKLEKELGDLKSEMGLS